MRTQLECQTTNRQPVGPNEVIKGTEITLGIYIDAPIAHFPEIRPAAPTTGGSAVVCQWRHVRLHGNMMGVVDWRGMENSEERIEVLTSPGV